LDNLKPLQDKIDSYIKKNIIELVTPSLQDVCLYCTGGKHIRAIVVISLVGEISEENLDTVIDAALCLEYVHSASLIFDDIVDKDITRRDKESTHIKYGTSLSQAAALQLIALSLYHLNRALKHLKPELAIRIHDEYANQIVKLTQGEGLNISHSVDDPLDVSVEDIISKKTSTLFKLALTFGHIYNVKFNEEDINDSIKTLEVEINKMDKIGEQFGQLFQIADDFEDLLEDRLMGQFNYVSTHGLDVALSKYDIISADFIKSMEKEKIYTNEIYWIVSYLYSKVHTYYDHWINMSIKLD